MKKIIFLAVLLLSISFLNAQISFGIKAGYNSSLGLTNLNSVATGDYNLNSVKAELSNGFHGGIFLRAGSNKLYFQPELLYAIGKKDYTISFKDVMNNDVTFDKIVNISTVDVPVLVGYKLLDLKKLANVRVFAGPKLRFNAGSTMDFNNLVTSGGINKDDLIKDIKTANLGLEAGFGIDLLMFTLDARYNIIGDLYQVKLNNLTVSNIPANTFVISLGWKLF